MQVFIPYHDFEKSVKSLDRVRLNKQQLECCQILDICYDIPTKTGKPRTGWLNHPAVLAWKNNPGALLRYTKVCIAEAKSRGIKTESFEKMLENYPKKYNDLNPIWMGDDIIHSSHRARLLQKGWEQLYKAKSDNDTLTANQIINWYKMMDWPEMQDDNLMCREYYWPVMLASDVYSLKTSVSKPRLILKEKMIQMYSRNPYYK